MIETRESVSSNSTWHEFGQTRQTERMIVMNTTEHNQYGSKPLRIMLPINAKEDSRWGAQYAVRRHSEGTPLEVVLLNIGEPITQWQVLRFRKQQEIADFQSQRAQAFIEEASQVLLAENIPFRGIFKQGDIVFSILDAAEELNCDEIVMPKPKQGVMKLFSRDIALDIQRRQRGAHVVLVNKDGRPDRRSAAYAKQPSLRLFRSC